MFVAMQEWYVTTDESGGDSERREDGEGERGGYSLGSGTRAARRRRVDPARTKVSLFALVVGEMYPTVILSAILRPQSFSPALARKSQESQVCSQSIC